MSKKLSYLTVFLMFQICSALAQGTIISVPTDFPAIQAAIDAASETDTVLVAPGTYLENINFRGKNIVLASHYILDNDPDQIFNTIIDGSNPTYQDTASCVLIVSGEDSTAMLNGFTLTGGMGSRWLDSHDGYYYREGGGILIDFSSPTICNNLIIDNDVENELNVVSTGGGGIRAADCSPSIYNNVIIQNHGRGYGGGIVLFHATGIVRNNIICQNSGGLDYSGGGIWKTSGGMTIIENNTIIENSSERYAGGMMVWGTDVQARNNIVWGNTAAMGYPQIRVSSGTLDLTFSNIEGGWEGEANIDTDPLFLASNFYFSEDSPCIDAGDPNPIFNDPEDNDNPGYAQWPSLGDLLNDIGAYGGAARTILPFPGIVTAIENNEARIGMPMNFALSQNYPNPFNFETTISFNLSCNSTVKLDIYDSSGRFVKTLVDGNKKAGSYSVGWSSLNESDKPVKSGVYFYKLAADGYTKTKRMTLLK